MTVEAELVPLVSADHGPAIKEVAIKRQRRILAVVFVTLLIDLFAFTVILPLFPSLIAYYQQLEQGRSVSYYSDFIL